MWLHGTWTLRGTKARLTKSRKPHLRLVQGGNACTKEGNTHVNGRSCDTGIRSQWYKLKTNENDANFFSVPGPLAKRLHCILKNYENVAIFRNKFARTFNRFHRHLTFQLFEIQRDDYFLFFLYLHLSQNTTIFYYASSDALEMKESLL